ncbi:uncharacterized protein SOCEGT47_071600 [Sorangium cellulosum]|uniref:Uncharacterized protein n=1 Tax=Sorangium cellulosum TaxID=56 RepID=A0A4P2QAC7_SORCE|nr:uncharacterized protein SOCEGT47_071600 [Sorangium cellulosum]
MPLPLAWSSELRTQDRLFFHWALRAGSIGEHIWTATNGWAALLDRRRALKGAREPRLIAETPPPRRTARPRQFPLAPRSRCTAAMALSGARGAGRASAVWDRAAPLPRSKLPSRAAMRARVQRAARPIAPGHGAPTATIEASCADASAWRPHTGAQRVATLHALGARLACRGVIGYRVADGAMRGAFAGGARGDSRLESAGRGPAASSTSRALRASRSSAALSHRPGALMPGGRLPCTYVLYNTFRLRQPRGWHGPGQLDLDFCKRLPLHSTPRDPPAPTRPAPVEGPAEMGQSPTIG